MVEWQEKEELLRRSAVRRRFRVTTISRWALFSWRPDMAIRLAHFKLQKMACKAQENSLIDNQRSSHGHLLFRIETSLDKSLDEHKRCDKVWLARHSIEVISVRPALFMPRDLKHRMMRRPFSG